MAKRTTSQNQSGSSNRVGSVGHYDGSIGVNTNPQPGDAGAIRIAPTQRVMAQSVRGKLPKLGGKVKP